MGKWEERGAVLLDFEEGVGGLACHLCWHASRESRLDPEQWELLGWGVQELRRHQRGFVAASEVWHGNRAIAVSRAFGRCLAKCLTKTGHPVREVR